MKTTATLFATTILISTSLLCQARLGESEVKCDLRYNPESKRSEPSGEDKSNPLNLGQALETTTFIYEGWKIRVGFLVGIARCMEYRKTNYKTPDSAEIDSILKANELGGAWQRISMAQAKTNAALLELWKYTEGTDYTGGFWLRSDGSIAYMTSGGFGSTLRLEHKKALDIRLKQTRETPKKEPLPKF